MCVLGKADYAILNCVSTFSGFAKRQRDLEGKKSEFWGFKLRDEFKYEELWNKVSYTRCVKLLFIYFNILFTKLW